MDHKFAKFIAVVEARNFTAAARQLHISQPALSSAIQELEKDLGATLILRADRQFSLTPEGQLTYTTALRMQRDYRELAQAISQHQATRPRVRIGLLDTVASLLLQSDLDWQHIEVVVDNSTRLLENVAHERVDAAVIVKQLITPPASVQLAPLGQEHFVFVGTPSCLAATQGGTIPNWLAFNADSTTYLQFTRQFEAAGVQVQPIFHSTSMELLHAMCLQGRGIALLPQHMVTNDIHTGALQTVGDTTWSRELQLAYQQPSAVTTVVTDTLSTLLQKS